MYSEHTRKTIPCHNCWVSGACTTTSCVCIHKSGEGERKKSASESVSNAERFVFGKWPSFKRAMVYLHMELAPLPLLLSSAGSIGGCVCVSCHEAKLPLECAPVCMRQCCCVSVSCSCVLKSVAHQLHIGSTIESCRLQLCRVSWFSQNLITHSYLWLFPLYRCTMHINKRALFDIVTCVPCHLYGRRWACDHF